jgi:low affinity Fe/Cu permease
MINHSKIGFIIFILGIFLLSSGMGRLSGALEYNSIISNKSLAITFICIGIFIMFSSFYIKPLKNK